MVKTAERSPSSIAKKIAKAIRRLYPKRKVLVVLESPGSTTHDFTKYRHDPVGFCREVLGVLLTKAQEEALQRLAYGGRVKINSGHNIGKSFLAACCIVWWFYTRSPGVVVTTAPTRAHVETVLWTEVRLIIMRAKVHLPDFLLPKAPKLYDNPDHWAEGITAASGEGFQGRHRPNMLFVFDEAEGIDQLFWNAVDTMFKPEQGHGWLAIGNPYTTSTQSYLEDIATNRDGSPKWGVLSLSALDHPNIEAELSGRPLPVPDAVSVSQVDQWVHSRCTPIEVEDRKPRDIEWPPSRPCPSCRKPDRGANGQEDLHARAAEGDRRPVPEGGSAGLPPDLPDREGSSAELLLQSWGNGGLLDNAPTGSRSQVHCAVCGGLGKVGGGKWYRPGPWFLAACMGIRPSGGIDTVWGEDVWNICVNPSNKDSTPAERLRECWLRKFGINIGVDAAAYGDDDTVFHVRTGPISLHHEGHNGWGPEKSAGRLKELCHVWSDYYNSLSVHPDRPRLTANDVQVTIEFDGGFGIGIYSHRAEFENWRGVTAGSASPMLSPTGRPMYANTRSQIWCEAAALGAAGGIDLSRLPREVLDRLRVQLTTPYYEVLPNGSRFVESKKEIKLRLRRSPDDADAFLISHHVLPSWSPSVITPTK